MEIYHPKDDELLREMRRVRRVRKRSRLLWGLFISLLLCAATGWFLYFQYFTLAIMEGPAMGETIPGGSVVLVRRNPAEGYQTGDVVLYSRESGNQMKRLLARGGDRVVFSPYSQEELRVNGQELKEPYITGRAAEAGLVTRRLTVPENELFVVGDQRSLSVDSRSREYGTIPAENVIGRAEFVLWPLYRFGTVKDASRLHDGGSSGQAGETEAEASETVTPEEADSETPTPEVENTGTATPEKDTNVTVTPEATGAGTALPAEQETGSGSSEEDASGTAAPEEGNSETATPAAQQTEAPAPDEQNPETDAPEEEPAETGAPEAQAPETAMTEEQYSRFSSPAEVSPDLGLTVISGGQGGSE